MLQINERFLPYLDNKVRYLHFYGGSGSGKSVFAAQKIIARIKSEKPHRILCVRKVANTLRSSIYQLLIDTILEAGIYNEFTINKSEMRFTHVSGNELLLVGLDDVERLKSIAGITSIWVEEATELTVGDFDQLDLRLRGETANYKQIIFSYNPIDERHWIKLRFHDNPSENFSAFRSTFLDNAFIDDEYRKVLESKVSFDENLYRIYYLGEWGIESKESKFCWAFRRDQIKPTERDFERILWATFDFNVNPMTCTIAQIFPEEKILRAIECIKLENSNVWEMCERLIVGYPDALWMVTGDATGMHHSAMVKDHMNFYKIIMQQLHIGEAQLSLPGKNPPIKENQLLVNMVHKQWNVEIDPDRCKPLIYDLEYVEVDNQGNLLKDRTSESKKADFLDGWRYIINRGIKPYLNL